MITKGCSCARLPVVFFSSSQHSFQANIYRYYIEVCVVPALKVLNCIFWCMQVVFTQFDGPIIVWLAPPPSNRMWISFLQPPKIKVSAKPLNVNAMVQYTAMVRFQSPYCTCNSCVVLLVSVAFFPLFEGTLSAFE